MRKTRRQRQHTLARVTPHSLPQSTMEPTGGWKKWALWAFWFSGWIVSVFLGLLDLPAKVVSFATNAPEAREVTGNFLWDYERFEGRFSSDPSAWTERNLVTEDGRQALDGGDVQLAIEYMGGGQYRGEIHSVPMANHFFAPWSRVMLDGELNAIGNFRGEVWDIVGNQRAPYTRFTLAVDNVDRGTLRLTPWRDDGIFPGEITLWPTDYEMSGGIPGKVFQNALREVTRNRCVESDESKNSGEKKRYPISCFGAEPSQDGAKN